MSNKSSVETYNTIIQAEVDGRTDPENIRLIYELVEYSREREREADNRDLRPRPDETSGVAYYENEINFTTLGSVALKDAVKDLIRYTLKLEQLLADD